MILLLFILIFSILLLLLLLYLFLIFPSTKHNKQIDKLKNHDFAHRGLHSLKQNVPENSIKSFQAAIDNGYGIEFDVHLSKDNKLIVMHDNSLERTSNGIGKISEMTSDELSNVTLKYCEEKIPFLEDVLKLVDGKVPLLIEIKTDCGNYKSLCYNCFEILDNYKGDFIVESFDPRVLMWLKKHRSNVGRGQLATNDAKVNRFLNFFLKNLLLNFLARPHFIAYDKDYIFKKTSVKICKNLFKCPIFAWTVTDDEEYKKLHKSSITSIFEGFKP